MEGRKKGGKERKNRDAKEGEKEARKSGRKEGIMD